MGIVAALSGRMRKNALHKGLLGGRRGWFAVGLLAYGWRFLRRVMRSPSEQLVAERLAPGETLIVESIPRHRRRRRGPQ